jgi:UDP-glucose 4-epimerase
MTAAADAGVERFVQMGSQEEPDSAKGDVIPTSPYAAAKWAASAYARMFHKLYGFGVVNLRVFMVYGPGQKDLKKLIPYSILECLAGRPPKIGIGTRKVDWVYVDDVVRGLLLAGIVPGVEGHTFEIGTSKLTSLREVVEMVVESANPALKAEFSTEGRKMEIEYSADYSQSESFLGWRPTVDVAEGIRRTVDWYSADALRQRPKPLVSA